MGDVMRGRAPSKNAPELAVDEDGQLKLAEPVVLGEIVLDQGVANDGGEEAWPVSPEVNGAPVDAGNPVHVAPGTSTEWDVSDRVGRALGEVTPLHGRVARSVHFASAALPAAGAYTSQTAYTIASDVRVVTFWITYTTGGSGGYPKAKVLLGNGTEEAPLLTIDPTLTIANAAASQPAYVGEVALVALLDGVAAKTAISVRVDGGQTTARCLLAEVGNTGTPGVAVVAITAGK